MKIDLLLQINNLRMLKGVLQTLHKILYEDKQLATIFLIYFTKSKQLRFLIDSDQCHCILALDPRIAINDKSVIKQDSEMLAIEFTNPESFLVSFCQLIDKENSQDITFNLSKDKVIGNEEAFRSLNFTNSCDKYRSEIFRPIYDPPKIIHHMWLNGIYAEDQKKAQFSFQIEQLLSLLRVVFRHKETQNKEKMVYIEFNFRQRKVIGSLDKLKHRTQGQIYQVDLKGREEEIYIYHIAPEYTGKLYELLTSKSSGRRFIINQNNALIFHYYHANVFESQIHIPEWIRFAGPRDYEHQRTKLQF